MKISQAKEMPLPKHMRYNWPAWADGLWREAEPGVDFIKPASFRVSMSNWCQNHDYEYVSRILDNGNLLFRITKP